MKIGSKVIEVSNVASTNNYAAMLARNGSAAGGTVITTTYQAAGRGQGTNSWESEDGKNLLMSVILYPKKIKASGQFLISMAVSLAICDFLERHTGNVKIKWPNDVYAGDDKIAGILIENALMGDSIESCIAGIGLNINQLVFRSGAPNPVSLSMITGLSYDINDCRKRLCEALEKRYREAEMEAPGLADAYNRALYRRMEWSRWREGDQEFAGRILDVAEDGLLTIERHDGSRSVYSYKEVEYVI